MSDGTPQLIKLAGPGPSPGGLSAPAGRPAPPPRRLLASAAGLLLLGAGPSLFAAVMQIAGMCGMHWSYAEEVRQQLLGIAAVAASYWLVWAVQARASRGSWPRWRRAVLITTALGLGVAAVYATAADGPWYYPGRALFGLALAWLAGEVTRAHGLTLGILPSRSTARVRHDRQLTRQLTQQALFICLAGSTVSTLIGLAVWHVAPNSPLLVHGDQMALLGIGNIPALVLGVVYAVTLEDVVLVAATVTLMTAARRPAWQIYTLIVTIEVLLHAYIRLPALSIALWATWRIHIYLRHRLLLPLMISHGVWDLLNGGLMPHLPVLGQNLINLAIIAAAAQPWFASEMSSLRNQPGRPGKPADPAPSTTTEEAAHGNR